MNRRHFLGYTAASGFATSLSAQQNSNTPTGGVQAGFSERDITPDIGMEMPGGYGKAYLRKLHDPCKVRAAVFGDGASRAALVGIDALIIPRHVVLAARQTIERKCGIRADSIMMGASHSHSSGPVGMVLPGEYDDASPLVRKLAYEQSSMANAGYLKRVEAELVNAVVEADSKRVPALLSFGVGHEDKAAYNRRFRMRNGQSWTHPGQGNPEIVKPAGPIDPQVGVITAYGPDGKMLGCIVNYACHATTSPDGISANWIYYLEKTIRGSMDTNTPVVFLQGFCGDITQVDNLSPYAQPNGEQWAKIVGGRVGAEAVKTILSAAPGNAAPIVSKSTLFRIPRRLPSPERVRRSLDMVQSDPKQVGVTNWIFAKEIVLLDAIAKKSKEADVEIQGIQVGPAVFISAPGEMFCQLGLDLKAGSPFKMTFPVELANGCVGYIPTEEALSASGGGYETRLTSYSNLVPTAGTQMVQAGLKLVRDMKPAPVPEFRKAPAFSPDPTGIGAHPWSYGNVPPELS